MAVTSFATAASFTVQETSKSNVFNVHYQFGQKGKVEVSILNNKNETVFKEEIKSTGSFIRPYNFSNLPYGDYIIVIKDEVMQYNEKVNYSATKLINYTYVAALPNQENKYWLNVRNNGQEAVNVRILSKDGVLIYEQSIMVNGGYNTVYNLSKVKRNEAVTFEVTDGNNKVHTTTFE
jgi:hypothetical protein